MNLIKIFYKVIIEFSNIDFLNFFYQLQLYQLVIARLGYIAEVKLRGLKIRIPQSRQPQADWWTWNSRGFYPNNNSITKFLRTTPFKPIRTFFFFLLNT